MTQQQFAAELGVTLSAIGKYETTYKPNRAMLRTFQNMCEDYGLPELVPIFQEAAGRPMSKDSTQFSGKARLDAAEKYVIDAMSLLDTVRNALMHDQTPQHFSREHVEKLRGINDKVNTLHSIVKELLNDVGQQVRTKHSIKHRE
jgi:transcriptional regulator with XRE-family HTH domain